MDAFGTVNNVISLFYAFLAVGVVFRLVRAGRRTFDSVFTNDDRRLAGAAAFYLATPFTVVLHELGHCAATWALGGRITDYHFMIYWGWVMPERFPPFSPVENTVITLAGNLVSLGIGAGLILWTWKQPLNAAWNFARLELARVILGLVLVFYPVLSLLLGVGDFYILRAELNSVAPHAGDAVLGVWALMAIGTWWMWRRGPWRTAYIRLTTPLLDSERQAQTRLESRPDDPAALADLARVRLAARDWKGARELLDKAVGLAPRAPQTRFLLGVAWLEGGDPRAAAEQFREAGQLLEDTPGASGKLKHEIMLGLAQARLALGDAEGAVLTIEAARELEPEDPRGLLMLGDALIAAGRREDARKQLEAGLEHATGALATELRRRIEALPRPR